MLERQMIKMELVQRQEEGCDVTEIESRILAALEDNETQDNQIIELYDELDQLQPDDSFSFEEPSELSEIKALRPDGPRRIKLEIGEQTIQDRIYGGWLGRAAGCSLGKPVEGWPRERIDQYLADENALPLNDYIPFREGQIHQFLKSSTRGNIEFMARDDDLDYPILGLIALERKGLQLSPQDMATTWLNYMPYNMLYTAENVAYRNFVNRRWPPESAQWRNPFREWIGAQIRADIFGYVTPGWPEKAAELAFQDASISHVKNGIYGEMFMAAMLAASFTTENIDEIIEIGLSEIPARCRLAEAVHNTMNWCREFDSWEKVWDRISENYGHYHTVHTINNAALVVMGLMFGRENYEHGIVYTVRGGWDTDCNGATVGSILGTKMGSEELPEKWIRVLDNRLMSVVRDFNDNQISDLADRTSKLAFQFLSESELESEASLPSTSSSNSLIGSWNLRLGDNECRLFVHDDLTGFIQGPANDNKYSISEVKTEDNKVRFNFRMSKGVDEAEISFSGTITNGRIHGQGESNGYVFAVDGERL